MELNMFNEDKKGDAKSLINYSQFIRKLKSAGLGASVSKVVEETEQIDELSKTTLKSYIKANKADTVQRASSDSFKSGKAGDVYNKADETHKDKMRERGLERALNKLSEEDHIDIQEFGEWTEEDFEKILQDDLDGWTDDDMLDLYEDDELVIVDEETGEEIEPVAEEAELDTPVLMEILSRQERLKAKARMRRTKTKRVRAEKVALKRLSTPQVANNRAHRMAISAMKKRLLRGQNPQHVSIGQKERIERFVHQRRKIINRLATRMVSRVRQVERSRMAGKRYNKPNNGVAF